jgi:hypothetical protein
MDFVPSPSPETAIAKDIGPVNEIKKFFITLSTNTRIGVKAQKVQMIARC